MAERPAVEASRPEMPTFEELSELAEISRPVVPDHLRPTFLRALEGPDPVRRLALQKLGATAWYAGEVDEAERLWRLGVAEGRDARDRLWRMALNNLSLLLSYQVRDFESLVVAGIVVRTAEPSEKAIRIFAGTVRARALLELDLPRAEVELVRCREWLAELPDDRRTETSLLSMEVDHALATASWRTAYALGKDLIEKLDPTSPDPVLLSARFKTLRADYHVRPERRDEILAELPAVAEGLCVAGAWAETWRRSACLFRWEAAVDRGERDVAVECAEEFLGIGSDGFVARTLEEALQLLERMDLPEPVVRVFTVRAADAVLDRFHRGQLDHKRVQELGDVDEADWASMASYQARLLRGAAILRSSFAQRWKPGLPAYDQLVNHDGQVTQCAWCGRVRFGDEWRMSVDLARLIARGSVSHGICLDCIQSFRGGRRRGS